MVVRVGSYPLWTGHGSVATYEVQGFGSPAEELQAFFEGDWCRFLCDGLCGYVSYLKQVKEIKDSGGQWRKRRGWLRRKN